MVSSIINPAELNSRVVDKNKGLLMRETTGSEIFIGDIIKLHHNQVAPCDMLLLASSDSLYGKFVCMVDTMLDDGKCARQRKECITLTKTFNQWTEDDRSAKLFLNRLTARICYQTFEDRDKISGSFKIKSDPKVETFDSSNIVKKGSQLKTKYVYGLVLYNGRPTSSKQVPRFRMGKTNGVETVARNFTLLLIVVNIICSICCSLLYVRIRTFEGSRVDSAVGFVSHMSLLSSVLPLSVNLFLNCFYILAAVVLRRSYREFTKKVEYQKLMPKRTALENAVSADTIRSFTLLEPSKKNAQLEYQNSLKILNPKVLPNLGDIDEAFFDKTGTLSTYTYDVKTISAHEKMWTSQKPNFISPQMEVDRMNEVAQGASVSMLPDPLAFIKKDPAKRGLRLPDASKEADRSEDGPDPLEKMGVNSLIVTSKSKSAAVHPMPHPSQPLILPPLPNFSKQAFPGAGGAAPNLMAGAFHSVGHMIQAAKKFENKVAEGTIPGNNESDFYEEFKARPDLQEIIFMFTVCHSARATPVGFESNHIEERALLKMAKDFGVTFENSDILMADDIPESDQNNYVISWKKKMIKVEYFFFLEHDPRRSRFSILIKQPDHNRAKLFVRGLDESMRKLIDSEKSHYDMVINNNKQKGLKSFVFASKTMSLQEAEKFHREYMAIKRTTLDQDMKMANLAKNLETGLELEAVVGLRNSLKEDAQISLDQLRNMGVNCHLISGDDLEHCLMAAYSLDMLPISKKESYFSLDFETLDVGTGQIKRALDLVTKGVAKLNSRTKEILIKPSDDKDLNHRVISLVLQGRTVDLIYNSRYFRDHFKFILGFTKVVVGYGFSPLNKAQLVEMYNEINKKTLAFGDGFNDVMMVRSACVGVQIFDKKMPFVFGDLVSDNLLSIVKAMNQQGRSWNTNLILSLHNSFKYSAVLVFCSVFYQVYCQFSGASILTSYFITIGSSFSAFISLYFTFMCPQIDPQTRDKILAIYTEKDYLTKVLDVRVMLYRFLPEAILVAAFIVFLTVHSLNSNTRAEGHVEGMNLCVLCVHLLAFLYYAINSIAVASKRRVQLAAVVFAILGVLVVTVFVLFDTRGIELAFRPAVTELFTSWTAVTLVISFALALTVSLSGYWDFSLQQQYFPVCEFLKRSIAGKDQALLAWVFNEKNARKLPVKFSTTESFTAMYRRCFASSKGSR